MSLHYHGSPGALGRALRQAGERVPFHRARFSELGIEPAALERLDDPAELLAPFPITDRETLLAAGTERLLRRGVDPRRCARHPSSGTLGRPFAVYLDARDQRHRRRQVSRLLRVLGHGWRDRLVVFGAIGIHRRRLHQRLGLYRSANVSRFASLHHQVRRLQELRPDTLWFYPTAMRSLLTALDDQVHRLMRPRRLLAAGEPVDPLLEARLSKALETPVLALYGASEAGILGLGCPRAPDRLHLWSDWAALELVEDPELGDPSRRVLVITTIHNRAMPLIRYRVGDVVTPVDEPCPCGSTLPTVRDPCRQADLVRLPSGEVLGPRDLGYLVGFPEIHQHRLTGGGAEAPLLEVVVREPLTPKRREALAEATRHRLGSDAQLLDRTALEAHRIKARTVRSAPPT